VLGSSTEDDPLLIVCGPEPAEADWAASSVPLGPFHNEGEQTDRADPSSQLKVAGPSQTEDADSNAVGPSGPALQSVRFQFSEVPPTPLCSPASQRNVTLSRGSLDPLPIHFFEGVSTPVKEKVADFVTYVRRAPSQAVLASPPPRRRARAPPELPTPLRRSERLARKSRHRATKPAVKAQNVMMKRLGVTSESCPPDATSFQRFTDTFSSTLTTSQCEALDVLLPDGFNRALVAATPMSP